MEYQPRYSQPFTLAEACELDPPIITEEIARLQNSLQHLQKTQEELHEYIGEEKEPDPELVEAKQENETVIGGQEERIDILRLALVHKGVVSPSSHYDLASAKQAPGPRQQGRERGPAHSGNQAVQGYPTDDDGGVML